MDLAKAEEGRGRTGRPVIRVSKASVGSEELKAIEEVFELCYFGMGSKVAEFEQRVQTYLGPGHVVAVNTGTSALHLALASLDVGRGDEVIVPSLTFVSSFQAISATGGVPVACEVDPDRLLIDVDDVRRRITARTKAIMPVHYTGQPCDMDEILALADEHGLRVVEDAAHAFGSTYRGRKIGSFGDVVCFSFDGIKNITTGEGGAVVCFDEELMERLRRKRLLGIDRDTRQRYRNTRTWVYAVDTQGYRYHMSNLNAAIGLAQLDKVEAFIARRRAICRRYVAGLSGTQGIRLLTMDYSEVAPHIFVIRVMTGRDRVMARLAERGIETGVHYVPNHLHPLYSGAVSRLRNTEEAYAEILTLPLHPDLQDADVEYVIKAVRDAVERVDEA